MKILFAAISSLFLVSCTGYQLGAAKPPSLANVKSISVPMFANGTQHPRAEALATSAVADAFVQDGTYRIAGSDQADAVLEGELKSIEYLTLRSSRLDSLLAEELTNEVVFDWVLRDARDPTKILASGSSKGSSSFFVDSNLQTARQNALPDAFERAGQSLVSRLASGY
ncbi:MAG: LPS assembly lipoprotein LptE [Akkermansiaceae bacterium]|nr:LPS assembly lipoprotein LptE [Akkermansiaceae bacterium]MDP4646671.1 LPS assembly lipoprotein LptE [Akkermansiaceae bacterium]MDP4721119.1 LPS assembly lipoprotein LptE [Akkermansiaceae bacterium]MDP4779587.1 LPS assembly lipoprotein LptE [Akkermansiaceae bacterium]MDP4846333.1 LPS assembly lipoprotein LptE [Akkermansiaceae bacterium]